MHYGIDTGSSGGKTSHPDRTGQPVIVRNARGGNSVRAVIYIGPNGETLVGDDAFEQSFVEPQNAISQFKLKLGSPEKLLAGKNAIDLTSILLVEVKRCAEIQTGETVDGAVLTVPANFTDLQKKSLIQAGEQAGIKVMGLVSEPAAAAVAYAANNKGEKFMVYDLGSSTFDVAVCEVDGDDINILTTEGEQKLGGDDIDEFLKGLILQQVEAKTGVLASDLLSDPLFRLDLATRTTQAKISLGNQSKVKVALSANGQPIVVTIERSAFEAAIEPLIARTLACVDKALQAAHLTAADLASLYMVGGSSRSPFIQNKVADHTGLVPRSELDPETVVAQGAALVAQSMLKAEGKKDRIGVDVIPPPSFIVKQGTHHDVGVAVEDRSNGRNSIINSVVVPKNTRVPASLMKPFRLESPDQRDVIIEILQGPDRADISNCLVIGRLELRNLPVELARSPRIEVTFVFDKDTCVTVIARDVISGQETSVTIDVNKP